jgi:hypothetical protein
MSLMPLFASVSSVHLSANEVAWTDKPVNSGGDQRKVVVFFLEGGLSHLESFDPKPDAREEVRGSLGTIQTALPGVVFSSVWPRLAAVADRMTMIRSLHHRHVEHVDAVQCMETLQAEANPQTPVLGSVVQWQDESTLPVYVAMNQHRDGSGALGTQYRPFDLQGPLAKSLQAKSLQNAGKFSVEPISPRGTKLEDRLGLLSTWNDLGSDRGTDKRTSAIISQRAKIREILASQRFREIMSTSQVSDSDKQRYGETSIGRQAILARNAVRQNMKFIGVNTGGWDMHVNLFSSFADRARPVDAAVASLVEDLDSSGELDSTIVLVLTEFGRSPLIAGTGRGHWPRAMAALACGGPIPRGHVVGDTGPRGEESTFIRHEPNDLLASLYQWLGLDWEMMIPGEDARLNTRGQPIAEIGFEA